MYCRGVSRIDEVAAAEAAAEEAVEDVVALTAGWPTDANVNLMTGSSSRLASLMSAHT